MSRTSRALSAALVIALTFTGTACGSSGSDDAASTTTAVADPGSDPTETTAAEPADGEGDSGDDGSTEVEVEGECLADSDQLSGSSTVVWDDGDVAPELTMTFGDDGMLDPATLTVPVGERFAIASAAGSDLRAVKVGCAGAQTMPGGITAGFVIDAPGTYTIIDEAADGYAGAEVGSVVVE